MAKQMMEIYAAQQGLEQITSNIMQDVRAQFESQYGAQQRCPFTHEAGSANSQDC